MDVGKFLGLDKLEGVIGRLERRPLRLYPGQCLRERAKTVKCENCARVCPVGAIDVASGVSVDFGVCVDCGICVGACPTGVFESRVSEDTFLAKVKQKTDSGGTVCFSCSKQLAAREDRAGSHVELPCLGRITETMLMGAAAFGAEKILLNLTGCVECENATGVMTARDLVAGVDRVLEAWGQAVEFTLTADPALLDETVPAAGVSGDALEYDRRELLSKFGREMLASGLGLAEGRIDRLANVFDPPTEEHFSYRLPRRRELFLRLLGKMDDPGAKTILADGLPIYGLKLDQTTCNFCGNCASFCPTQALELVCKESTAELRFTVSRCVACDLCIDICAPESLSAEPYISLGDIFTERTTSLSEQQYYKCEKCKMDFASATETELCDFCRLRQEKLGDDSWS